MDCRCVQLCCRPAIDKMPDLPSYGSLKNNVEEEEATDTSFQTENAYYLKDATPMSAKKFLLLAVPILGAVLMMGGIVIFLLRDFGHLYPGRGGDRGYSFPNGGGSEHTTTTASSSADDTTFHRGSSSKSSASSKCTSYPKCSPLTGQCCPTLDGVFLECCN